MVSNTRQVYAFALAVAGAAISACSSETPTGNTSANTHLEVVQEVDLASSLHVDPRTPQLQVGYGIILRARIVDANGNTVAGARPEWRSTQPSIVSTTPIPDSVGVDGARISIAGRAAGSAMVIATYNNLADTARVTVTARTDTTINNGGGTQPPPYTRPTSFDATIIVRGFVQGADSSTSGTQLVPGTVVTLTRLPSTVGDSLPSGVTSVTTPTVFATLTVDANSQAIFRTVPQSRFRVNVAPPAGSGWQPSEFTYPPPQIGNFTRLVTLLKQ